MPGIAGLILSLGMAVDANVLIFERIREEFNKKQAAGVAIRNGYGRAFTAILDSNLTTIIIGVILFVVGTGPIRGFAITLTAGVVISMFTAVVVTRLVFDHMVNPASTKPFKMLCFFKNPNYDFLKLSKYTVGGSFIFIAVALAIFAMRLINNPASVLAVDLTGGTSIVYNMKQDQKPEVKDIRAALNSFDNATVIQYQEGVGDRTLLVKTGETASMEFNFLEITKDVMKMALVGTDRTSADEKFDLIESTAFITEGEYLENVAFVGQTLDGRNIIVIMDNALCTSGFESEGKNKEAGVFTCTFECHADLTSDMDTLPYHIYFPKSAEVEV
jgi:preprotein translocase subunit SecD